MNIFDLIDRLAGWWLDWRADYRVKHNPELSEFAKIGIRSMDASEMVMESQAIAYFAEQAAGLLEKNNAKNYVQFDMMPRIDRGLQPIRVTVAWASGESPAEKAARLERGLDELIKSLGTVDKLPDRRCKCFVDLATPKTSMPSSGEA